MRYLLVFVFNMMKIVHFHSLILIIVISLIVVVRYQTRDEFDSEVKKLKLSGKLAHYAEKVRAWQRGVFTPLTDEGITQVCQSLVATGVVLSAEQRLNLNQTLNDFFQFYRQPTFGDFVRKYEKFGIESTKRGAFKTNFNNGKSSNLSIASFDEKEARSLWELKHALPSGGKRMLTAVSTSGVQARLSSVASTNGYSLYRALGKCTVVSGADSVFNLSDSPEKIVQATGTNLFADIYFIARANSSSNAGPFFASYFWSDKKKSWLPHRLFFDAQTEFNAAF